MRTARMSVTMLVATLTLVTGSTTMVIASEHAVAGASSEALRIARVSRSGWRLGRLVTRQHGGRHRVEAELLADGTSIAWLRVDPDTGWLVARGERLPRGQVSLDPARLRSQVEQALGHLELATWAWPTEHGRAWAVPLRWQGRVVGTIKVDVRGARVLAADDDEDDD